MPRTIEELARAGPVHDEWRDARDHWPHMYVVDAVSYFSRAGPRLVDGVELLAAILHPELNQPVDSTKAIKLRTTVFAMDAAS
ncbi:MAG: hypothetical protein HY038_10295 [Nitrospirae bacterium]|nr:hypothetical protein [Nitrospirota bacterium]